MNRYVQYLQGIGKFFINFQSCPLHPTNFVWKLLGTHARAWGSLGLDPRHQQAWPWWNEWVIKFKDLFQTADSEVCVIHISCVIMTYTLELLSSLTKITHHLQVTKTNKKKHKKVRAPIKLTFHWRRQLYIWVWSMCPSWRGTTWEIVH